MYNKIIKKLENKNIAILGFGKEGKSSYNFIRKHLPFLKITIIDKNNILENNEYLNDDKNLTIVYGDNYLDNLDKYDFVIKSPGISFKDIDKTNINITSQIELLLEVYKDNVIGITGTKGKSTTTSLLYKCLKDQNKDAYLVGNIGVPVLDEIENYNENTILVMEMSSHQLEFLKVSPHIGIVLNLYEDHLDHAGSLENYHNSKMNMFKYQTENDIGIYSNECDVLKNKIINNKYKSQMYKVSSEKDNKAIYIDNDDVVFDNIILYNRNNKRNLVGEHNLKNIMFVLLVCELLKLDNKKVVESIENFVGLEHRLELVGKFNDIIYYNDTIATIPEATINGIKALKNVDTLIFGGMDRGICYDELINYLNNSEINNLICMPTTGHKIGNVLKEKNTNKNIVLVDTLEEAVIKAKQVTNKNKICLLSPAASSYEYFKNFEEKGKCYKELINKHNKN